MRALLLLALAGLVALVLAALLWQRAGLAPPQQPGPSRPAPARTAPDAPAPAVPRESLGNAGSERAVDPHVGVVRVLALAETRAPLADCTVQVGDAQGRTGSDGAVEFELAPGRHWLDAQAPDADRMPVRQRVTAVGGRVVEVTATLALRIAPGLWCRVVAADERTPLQGAHLVPQPSADAEVETPADGTVLVPGGGEAEFVRVVAPGRALRRVVPAAGHATAAQALEVPLERAAELQIAVVDAGGGAVGDVDVTVTAMAWSLCWPAVAAARGGPELWTVRVGADGIGLLRDLPPHCPLVVAAAPPTCAAAPGTATFELAPGRNERQLVLQPLAEVHGRVVDAGDRPVALARVVAVPAALEVSVLVLPERAQGESTTTAADGTFQLVGLAAGAWLLGLQGTPDWSASCRRIELRPGDAARADLRAEPALAISGRLLGPGNQPISAFEVHALVAGIVVATAVTERDGSYRLEALAPGDYDVATELYEHSLAMAEPVRATAGRSDVDLRVVSVLGAARGHCEPQVDDAGDWWLRGWRRGGTETCGGRCDLDHRFEQSALRAGTWDFAVTDARGNVGVLHGVEVVAGGSTPELAIVVRPGAIVRPSHPAADAFRIERGDDVAARAALERGLPGEAIVPPGDWTVVFLRAGFAIARRDVTLAQGQQQLVAAQ